MRNNIIIVLADFYPNPSPNTTCFMPLVNELAKYHNVDIVTSDTGKMDDLFFGENISVHRIKDRKMINHFRWLGLIEKRKNKILKKFLTYCSYVSKLIYGLIYNDGTDEQAYVGWKKSKVREKIEELLKNKDVQYVISISHPFKTHDIVYELKDRYVFKWYMLEYDAYGINDFLFSADTKALRMEKEQKYFKKADKIILTPQLYRSYLTKEFKCQKDKFYLLEFCNLYRPKIAQESGDFNINGKVNLFYAGAFNIYIRNPKDVLVFLSKTKNDFLFTIVTKCHMGFVNDELKRLGEKVRVLPRQRFDDVYNTECKTDFNISIGNSIDYQSPGKTLELMSAGRPIVHFAFLPTDPVLSYLKDYPNVLVIKLYEDIEKQIDKFDEFISKQYLSVTIEEIIRSNQEYAPQYIKDSFIGLF